MDKSFTISLIAHRSKQWILVCFERNAEWNKRMKAVPGTRWSRTHKGWLVPDTAENRRKCKVGPVAKPNTAKTTAKPAQISYAPSRILPEEKLSKENLAALEKFIEQLKLKAYSESTIKTYRNEFLQLLQLLKKKPVNDLTADDLKRYMVYAMEKEGIKENTAHSRLNALKFYYEQVLHKEKFFWEIPRPKKPFLLPRFFNQDEITSIINSVQNLKHKTMLMLCYSTGLRVSEVVTLRTYNVDSRRMCILVEQAKGKKDRIAPLSPVLLVMLRKYATEFKPPPKGYLFEGQAKGEPYSSRSLQEVLQAAKQKAQVLKPGGVHALRHSFATHLLDKGTDISMIQKLLGHNDIKTTLRYLHTTNKDILNIISPLDNLSLKM